MLFIGLKNIRTVLHNLLNIKTHCASVSVLFRHLHVSLLST